MTRRKVLVVGSGGREHALALRLLESASVSEVVVTPGNAGTAAAPAWAGSSSGSRALRNAAGDPLEVARHERPDLVVVGPEAPLCEGLVDRLAAEGIVAFGPTAAAARLEGSKAFMKDFVRRAGIATARHEVLRAGSDVEACVRRFENAPVVKADGLCAGKGVVVAATHEEAIETAHRMLAGDAFGEAGRTVVLEERITGAEASIHAVTDGERVVMLPAAQDHKRIGDGDRGPNTGGMGTYAPAPLVTPELADRIRRDVFERTVRRMAEEGTPYRGVLFGGFMITASGEPTLLEFNVRFGDPETQVLMAVLDGDLAEAFAGAAVGQLDANILSVSDRHAVCVVVAAGGYPGAPAVGAVIEGLTAAEAVEGVRVYHAGTTARDGRVIVAGGRVLGVTGAGADLRAAHARAYAAVAAIHFPGAQYRRDIGARALPATLTDRARE